MSLEFVYLADREDAVPIVARWYHDEWGAEVKGSTFESTCEMLREKLNRGVIPFHLLAIHDGEIAGVAELRYREMEIFPDKEHWLAGVYVSSAARGHGIAARLIERVVELARGLGVEMLHLQTERHDGGLYGRLGWRPIDRTIYKGIDVTVMERDLTR